MRSRERHRAHAARRWRARALEPRRATSARRSTAIGELGELVRGHLELAADDVPDARFAAMWREIDKQIESRPRGRSAALGLWRRVSRFGSSATAATSSPASSRPVRSPRSRSCCAAARRDTRSSGEHDPIDVRPVAHRPAEIESLDTPGGTGTVFHLDDPDDKDGSTTVIWVTPEDTVEGI